MVNLPKVSVLIPLYRGRAFIKSCLESLLAQKNVILEILLLDNGCPENTGEWAGFFLAQNSAVSWHLIETDRNIGFASGMNLLYAKSEGEYVLFLNQDVTLAPDHLEILVSSLNKHPDWAGVCGTLLRPSNSKNPVIDTTGHVIFRDRIVRNRGKGKVLTSDVSELYPEGEVFGLSAACSLFKRDALSSAMEPEGPFDPDFFAYFEDIDLDYRIHRAGWKLGYVPKAIGWHALGGSGARKELRVRIRSYGNRWRVLLKHESLSSILPDLVPILIQDTYSFFKSLITDPLAWLAGPWILIASLTRVLKRRKYLDRKFGTDRLWITQWLQPELSRWKERH